jgi:hypothetical protein
MIDLSLFHPAEASPDADWFMADWLNSLTSRRACRNLEWSGWYSFGIPQRLLGHYRLFQHFKTSFIKLPHVLPVTRAYVLQYRSSHWLKYSIGRLCVFLYSIVSRDYFPIGEIAVINRKLICEHPHILEAFLINADIDFKAALHEAIAQINDPAFFNRSSAPTFLLHVNQTEEILHANQYNSYDYSQVNNQINIQPAIKEGPHGKDTGSFSKKQTLIFFDLLSQCKDFDPIDYTKPNKFEAYADLLHALTGKNQQSIVEELHYYRNHQLYEWHTQAQLNQLIIILTNLADKFRKAGFRSFVKLADKKIRELESARHN